MRRFYIAIPLMVAGCANVGSIHNEVKTSEQKVISIDMQQRVILVKPTLDAQGKVVLTSTGAPVIGTERKLNPAAAPKDRRRTQQLVARRAQ